MVRQEIKSFVMDTPRYQGLLCTAPCSLYSVLFENGIIADPLLTDSIAELNKFASDGCSFTAEFEITPLIMSMKNVLLRFNGIDSFAKIELNGHELARADNIHRAYVFDVKTKLSLGKNVLRLSFSAGTDSPVVRRIGNKIGAEGAPELLDMGIFRKVEIVAFNHKIISDVEVKQTHSESSVRLDITVNTIGYDDLSRAVATLTSPAGNVYFCGFVGGEGSITVTDPNLWWPNGLGMQNLYKLNVNLYSESEIEDTYEIKVGLRTVSLQSDGESTALLVNGHRLFAMGGEYMCEDLILSNISEERTRKLIEDAKAANFNSVLIHGDGYYPQNYFLDACDEDGLVVWAELPRISDEAGKNIALKDSFMAELKNNLTRMAHHPSVAVIIGNKSLPGLFDSDKEAGDFAGSFSKFEGMNVFDLSGECRDKFTYVAYPSLPTLDTVRRLAEPSKRNLGSDVFELHGADSNTVMRMISDSYEFYPYANGMRELSYVSGMCSAELSMLEVEEVRRQNKKPLGILMKRMNDAWPSISPSAVDYYGGKKPLYYYERAFFSPVRISVVQKGTRVRFILSNDTRQDYVGIFAYSIMNGKNQPIFRDSFPIRARASSNLEVHNVDLGSVLSGHEQEYYLLYSVSDKVNEASKGIHLFTKTKRFAFSKPNYTIEIIGNGTEYVATVGADCFVKGVELSFGSEEVCIDKNYFDITGKAPVRVHLSTPRITTVEKLKRVIELRSVYDLGRED